MYHRSLITMFGLFVYLELYRAALHQCNTIHKVDFEECYWGNNKTTQMENDEPTEKCVTESICKREFRMILIKLQPYVLLIHKQITKMFKLCCGKCASLKIVKQYNDVSEITIDDIANSDFVYPFLGSLNLKQLYGFHFVPVFNTPSAQYITLNKRSAREMLIELILSCAGLWPLLLICILMTFISGFVAWLLETRKNEDEFPRAFFVGVLEGFWWSFISMTTVGYGDKSPRSFSGRLFSVFWIFIGITISSMFTAALTTEITSAFQTETPKIEGTQVGLLRGRLYEALLVAQNKGTLYTISDDDWYNGVKRLFKLLSDEVVEGFIIDTYISNLFKVRVVDKTPNYDKTIHNLLVNRTIHTVIFNNEERLSFGMLVKKKSDYNYFRRYFVDNRLSLETCNSLTLNIGNMKKKEKLKMFSVKVGVFWPSFITCVGIILLIFAFGMVFELHRRKILCRSFSRINVEKK